MAFRGNEMGMDFEYENSTGPIDARSPFARLAHNVQRPPASGMARKRLLQLRIELHRITILMDI